MNSTMISRRSLLASAGLLAAGGTLAQTPSNKITTLVLSVPPGGAVDVLGRELSTLMGKALGTTIVVESKAGASGMLSGPGRGTRTRGWHYAASDAQHAHPLHAAPVPEDCLRRYA